MKTTTETLMFWICSDCKRMSMNYDSIRNCDCKVWTMQRKEKETMNDNNEYNIKFRDEYDMYDIEDRICPCCASCDIDVISMRKEWDDWECNECGYNWTV